MSQNQGSGWNQGQQYQPPPPPPPTTQSPWNTGPQPQGGWPSKYCPSCGASIDARAEICPGCGVRQPPAGGEVKSRPLAIVLALLIGGFGIHRFYLGPVAWGVAYLVFFWTGIPAFLAWLEALYFLTRSNEEWAAKYGGAVQQPSGVAMGCLWILALFPLLVLIATGSIVFISLGLAL
jgi:TM2 domain-containing membrane protein YozV